MDTDQLLSRFLDFLEGITGTRVHAVAPSNCLAANAKYAARVLSLEPPELIKQAQINQWINLVAQSVPYLHSKEGLDQLSGDCDVLLKNWKSGGIVTQDFTMADYFLMTVLFMSGLYGKKIQKFKVLKKVVDAFRKDPKISPHLDTITKEDLSRLPKKQNIVPYATGGRMRVEFVINSSGLVGQVVTVRGWAKTVRIQGGGRFAFIALNDGSTVKTLQVIVDKEVFPEFDQLTGTGISVSCTGEIVQSPGEEQSVEMHIKDPGHEMRIIGQCDASEYPLAKKQHSLEYLRSIAHLRPRTNTIGAVIRVRNALAYATHKFFNERGFLYIHTPIITASDCEGAGEMFQVTTALGESVGDIPQEAGRVNYERDFFKKPAFLTVSGQLAVENFCLGLSDVYTFGPTFRAENSHTSRHLAEFWMIEPELAFAGLEEDMECAESYLKFCIQHCFDNVPEDLEFFDESVEVGLIERLKQVLATPFARMTYTEAVERVQKSGRKFSAMPQWGDDLQSEHERYICEEVVKGPVIVYNYPKVLKAFYMKVNDDDQTVQAMDVLVPKIGEVIGGSVREDRLDRLDEMLRFKNLDPAPYWWYRDLRKYGSVPHCGFGLGFERLVMMLTGMENIRDVIPYPRYPGHAEF